MQYEIESSATQFLSVALLGFCGSAGPVRAAGAPTAYNISFAAAACCSRPSLFGEVISYTSHDTYSQLYGLVFIGIFLCARLIVQEIGVPDVIRAYSQAAILTVCLLLISGRQACLPGSGPFQRGDARTSQSARVCDGRIFSGYRLARDGGEDGMEEEGADCSVVAAFGFFS